MDKPTQGKTLNCFLAIFSYGLSVFIRENPWPALRAFETLEALKLETYGVNVA
jgi:hypothetical protein